MPVHDHPLVEFSVESASFAECASWLAGEIVRGELDDDIQADVVHTLRIGARVIDGLVIMFSGQPVMAAADGDTSHAIRKLCHALSVPSVAAGEDAAAAEAVPWQLIITLILEFLKNLRK